MKRRRRFTPEFKAQVVLEVLIVGWLGFASEPQPPDRDAHFMRTICTPSIAGPYGPPLAPAPP